MLLTSGICQRQVPQTFAFAGVTRKKPRGNKMKKKHGASVQRLEAQADLAAQRRACDGDRGAQGAACIGARPPSEKQQSL